MHALAPPPGVGLETAEKIKIKIKRRTKIMKLSMKVIQSLPEAQYVVTITGIKLFRLVTEKGVKVVRESNAEITKELLDDMIANKTGYFDLLFKTKTDPVREASLRIWPQRFIWTMSQLADKAKKDIEDTADLVGCEIPLFFAHSYTQTIKDREGNTTQIKKLSKSWNLYGPNDVNAPVDADHDTDDLDLPDGV